MPSRGCRWFLLLAAAGAWPAWAAPKEPAAAAVKGQEKLMANCRGSFDMARNARPYAAYLVLDQTGTPYPSFWCGKNAGGRIDFDGQHDELEDRVVISQTGKFTVAVTNAARKYGMSDKLPGGAWVEKLDEAAFQITFEEFRDAAIVGTRKDDGERGAGGNLVQVETKCRGQVSVMGRTAPFAGTARLEFSEQIALFRLEATFPFPGPELGLTGKSGQGITATVHTSSAPSGQKNAVKLD